MLAFGTLFIGVLATTQQWRRETFGRSIFTEVLISGAVLRDPRPDDLIAVAVTGAYCYSLASNYNGAMRLPVVFCQDGTSRLVVRRETHADFLSRDVAPL